MRAKVINSQLSNFKSYKNYLDKMLLLAENVFQFKGVDNFVDMAVVNLELVTKGSVAWFYDDVMKMVVALPYSNVGDLDMYGRPTKIMARAKNGQYYRYLNRDEFVIMYDNDSKLPIYSNILSAAERMALIKRTIDINTRQQQTPRFWKTSEENKKTINDLINEVEANVNTVITYDNIDIDETTLVLEPAPYVSDKLTDLKKEEWAEFLELIGISNLAVQKKERVIRDEITSTMGGTIASRYSRFESRRKAIEEINKKWGKFLEKPIEVEFYDGLPTTIADANYLDEEIDEEVGDNDVSMANL